MPVTSGDALAGATQTISATIMTANKKANLSQGIYGCMCAKNNFIISPPFFKLSGLFVNIKRVDLTKLLPRIIVDKIGGYFVTKAMCLLLPSCDKRSIII